MMTKGRVGVHRPQRERLAQGIVNRRGAVGLEVLDEILRLGAVGRGSVPQLVKQRFHFRGEPHQFKTIAFVQILHAELQRLFRLGDLLAGHRAGGIQHKHHVFQHHLALLHIHPGRSQEQEIAVFAGRFIGQQVQANLILLRREVERKVGVGLDIGRLESNGGPVRPVASDLDGMAGRIDGFEGLFGFKLHFDAHVLDRLGGKFFGVERIDVADQAAIGREHLGIGKGDALVAVWLDGENPHLEDIPARVFQQGGVLQFAHDVLVNGARLVGGQQLGLDLLAADFHGELVNLAAFGDGKQVSAFQPLRVGIVELLVHRRGGDLAVNLDVDVMVSDFQGRVRPGRWPRGHDRPRHSLPVDFINDNQPVRE